MNLFPLKKMTEIKGWNNDHFLSLKYSVIQFLMLMWYYFATFFALIMEKVGDFLFLMVLLLFRWSSIVIMVILWQKCFNDCCIYCLLKRCQCLHLEAAFCLPLLFCDAFLTGNCFTYHSPLFPCAPKCHINS